MARNMSPTNEAFRARAEALFKQPGQQKGHASGAVSEYRAAQEAALDRMRELRRLRLTRDSKLGRDRG